MIDVDREVPNADWLRVGAWVRTRDDAPRLVSMLEELRRVIGVGTPASDAVVWWFAELPSGSSMPETLWAEVAALVVRRRS